MKKVNVQTIRDIQPCYDPKKFGYFRGEWSGTALDVLQATEAGVAEEDYAADRLFVVLRKEFIDEAVLVRFVVWCLREEAKLWGVKQAAAELAWEAGEAWADGKIKRKKFERLWAAAGYPQWDADAAFFAAREVRRAVPWKKQREKVVELLVKYEG